MSADRCAAGRRHGRHAASGLTRADIAARIVAAHLEATRVGGNYEHTVYPETGMITRAVDEALHDHDRRGI
ncbi:hypothetical protein [Streptomyces sp. NBC_00443]|uniref:hypothetical protein n=1 Tax=Streptomyces sp. NBC_00443 TaxID=2975743 RepID=UPI002E1AEEAC